MRTLTFGSFRSPIQVSESDGPTGTTDREGPGKDGEYRVVPVETDPGTHTTHEVEKT